MTYGRSIRWTDALGTQTVTVSECATAEEATEQVIRFARRSGWTPPRWWQWWRWRDTTARQLLDF